MQINVHEIGDSKSRVVVIDDFFEHARAVVEAAAALGPYPPEKETAYPGLRRQIGPGDALSAYVVAALRNAAATIRSGFGAATFAITEASFSMVTTPPANLTGVQRVPHIDCDDQSILAIIHHLHDVPDTGTAFYRHRASGLERADPANSTDLRRQLKEEAARLDKQDTGFVRETNHAFEKIFAVEGRFNRLVMYQGCLLHSGVIPDDFSYSPDPRKGRLTANMFVRMDPAVTP